MGFFGTVFNSHVETSDNHRDESLRTHYYKTSKDKLIVELETLINKNKSFSLLDVSKERGEVSINVKGRKTGFLVFTVVTVRPYRTSVDLSFTVERGINLGFGQKLIRQIYSELNKSLTLVDKGANY